MKKKHPILAAAFALATALSLVAVLPAANPGPSELTVSQQVGRYGLTGAPVGELLLTLNRLEAAGREVIAVLPFDKVQGFCGDERMVPPEYTEACEFASYPEAVMIVWRGTQRPTVCR